MAYKRKIEKGNNIRGYELAFNILNPCDYAVNGYYSVYNLKAKNPGYYSILLGQIDVLGEKVGIAPRDNLNKIIEEKKPKLISNEIYWDTYWEQRGINVPAHILDENIVKKYYNYSHIGSLYILKTEYQKHQCVQYGRTWRYID